MKESVPMIRFVIFHEGGCFYVFLMLLDAIIGRSLMNHGDRYIGLFPSESRGQIPPVSTKMDIPNTKKMEYSFTEQTIMVPQMGGCL